MIHKNTSKVQGLFLTFILFSVILATLTLSVDHFVFGNSAKNVALNSAFDKAREKEHIIADILKDAKNSLIYLKESQSFKKFISNPQNKNNLAQEFLSYAKARHNIMHIRYLDKNGMEKIRVEKEKDGSIPFIVEDDKLQNKSYRYYFDIPKQNWIKEKVWFSAFDLNMEKAQIEKPNRPTFRAVIPINTNDRFNGMLVINYFTNNLIKILANNPIYDMVLFDNDGKIIIDPDDNKNLNSFKDKRYNISVEFPQHYQDILSKHYLRTKDFVSVKLETPIYNGLNILLQLKKEYINQQKSFTINRYLTLSIIILLSAMILSVLVIRFFSSAILNIEDLKRLNQDMNAASKIAKIGFWEYDAKSEIITWSEGTYDIFEIDDKNLMITRADFYNHIHPDDLAHLTNIFQESVKGKYEYHIIHRIITKKNNIKYVDERAKHYFNPQGVYIKSIGSIYDITEKYELDKKIDDIKNRYKLAIDSTKDGVWDWDPNTNTVYFSDTWKRMLGFEPEEISNDLKEWEDRVHPEDMKQVILDINDHLEGKTELYQNIHRVRRKDNSYIWVLDRGKAQFDKNGKAKRVIGFHTDVTEQKNNEQKLQDALNHIQIDRDNYKKLIEKSSEAIIISDMNAKIIRWSDEFREMLGYSDDEMSKLYIYDFEIGHSKETVQENLTNSQYKKLSFETIYRKKDSTDINVWVNAVKLHMDGKDIIYGSIRDITLQKKAQKEIDNALSKIKDERSKYRNLMKLSSEAIFILDNNAKLIEYSEEAKNILGYNDEEMKQLYVFDWDQTKSKDEILELIRNGQNDVVVRFETKHVRKDGSVLDVAVAGTKITINGNDYYYTTTRDITEQKRLQRTLIDEKEKFEAIFNYSKEGIAIIDLESNFLEFNQAYLDMTGFTREEMLNKSCIGLTAPEDIEKSKILLDVVSKQGYMVNFEKSCIVKGGKKILTNMSASLLPDKQSILLVAKDMTSLKLLDEQSKLAAMGEMIGNIAHQWRQPLSVISTSASSIKFKLDFDQTVDKDFMKHTSDKIVEQVIYLSKTIDDFRNFIKGDSTIEDISIKEVLENTFSLVDATIKNNYINLVTDIEDDLIINGNKNELQQAIINIINNAKDALKEKIKYDDDKFIFVSTKKIDKNTLRLKIRDSGGGIDNRVLDRIFEPYFTTKDENTGTGIGLSMVDKIISERHQGEIKAYNESYVHNGKNYTGACFEIIFKNDIIG